MRNERSNHPVAVVVRGVRSLLPRRGGPQFSRTFRAYEDGTAFATIEEFLKNTKPGEFGIVINPNNDGAAVMIYYHAADRAEAEKIVRNKPFLLQRLRQFIKNQK